MRLLRPLAAAALAVTLLLAAPAGAHLGEVASWPVETGDAFSATGLSVAPDGVVYTAAGDRVLAFAADGTPLPPLTAGGALERASSVTATGDAIWVTESERDRVRKLGRDGSLLATWGAGGDVDVALDRPHSIAVAGDRVHVMEATLIRVFSPDGGVVASAPFFAGGEIAAANGLLYATEPAASRVAVLSRDGRRLRSFGRPSRALEQFPGSFSAPGPRGVAVDGAGDVWVGGPGDARVQRFSAAGRFETACGAPGRRTFRSPVAVAAEPAGTLLVLDAHRTIRRIGDVASRGSTCDTTGPPVSRVRMRPGAVGLTRRGRLPRAVSVRLRLDEDARVSVRIECVRPRRCERPPARARSARAGVVRMRLGGLRVRPGAHRVAVTATDAAGNRTRARSRPFRVRAPR